MKDIAFCDYKFKEIFFISNTLQVTTAVTFFKRLPVVKKKKKRKNVKQM